MVARLVAIKIVLGLLLLTGCASGPAKAPRFVQPSTVPIHKAIAVTQQHQSNVAAKLQKAKTVTASLSDACPQAKDKIDALTQDLEDAYADNQLALMSLQSAEGARDQLQTELASQVKQCNQLASDYDKAGAQITSLKESRHGWVKRFWIAAGAGTLCLIWIFRKPLLLLVGL